MYSWLMILVNFPNVISGETDKNNDGYNYCITTIITVCMFLVYELS